MLNPLVFYLIAITLIPLGLGPESELLAQLAPGMLWVMAWLATLLALDGLFRSDFDDGSLEQDRKSTRLNSSHVAVSYAVFCWRKKNAPRQRSPTTSRSSPTT